MNNIELQATRKLLMLDVAEAADLIGQVSPRTWQYWESGRNTVPADVSDEMQALLSIRGEMIDAITEQLPADGSDIELRFHSSFEQFEAENRGKNRVQWRLSQSVAALFFTEGHAQLTGPEPAVIRNKTDAEMSDAEFHSEFEKNLKEARRGE